MNKKEIEAIIGYVDAKTEYEIELREEDEDGYRSGAIEARKAVEKALANLGYKKLDIQRKT